MDHNPHKNQMNTSHNLQPYGMQCQYPQSAPQPTSILATPSTFSFTPLTKPVDEASKKEERAKDEEKAGIENPKN